MIDPNSTTPTAPLTPAPTVTSHVEPHTKASPSDNEAATMAGWIKADLATGKKIQAQKEDPNPSGPGLRRSEYAAGATRTGYENRRARNLGLAFPRGEAGGLHHPQWPPWSRAGNDEIAEGVRYLRTHVDE
jgi:hypothetical protein